MNIWYNNEEDRENSPASSSYARVAKLVDAYASGAYVARHGGSSPLPGTKKHPLCGFFCAREASALRHSREDLKPFSVICEERSDEQIGKGYCSCKEKDSSPGHYLIDRSRGSLGRQGQSPD